MTSLQDDRGSALLLLIGLLILSITTLLIAMNATHYFLNKQHLHAALDRTLMIAINTYDMKDFMQSGEFKDIRLDQDEILAEFSSLLSAEFAGAELEMISLKRDEIFARVVFRWSPPITIAEIGQSDILAEATIKSQIVNPGA